MSLCCSGSTPFICSNSSTNNASLEWCPETIFVSFVLPIKLKALINDASALGGKTLVTFEELYDMSNPDEPIKVAEHKDIEDKGETVSIKEVPEKP